MDAGLDKLSKPIFYAKSGMNSRNTEKLIDEFKAAKKRGGGLLYSVMRGRSAEGSDFPGDDMEIVIIVGIPYPPQTLETKLREEYYSRQNYPAWFIVYEELAFKQINQAAGRAIRLLEDAATIYLLDERIEKKVARLSGWMRESIYRLTKNDKNLI